MKRITTIAATLLMTASIWAQAPEKMSYQAVIRNSSNALVTTQSVGMQISILQGGATGNSVYVETQNPSTNANGLVSLEIGTGTVVSGDLTIIDWANGTYFIKTETDPTGGANYTITGVSQLLSVPYALYAKTAGSSLPGPQGATGNDGADGNDGATGTQSTAGINGADGNDGADGQGGVTTAGTNVSISGAGTTASPYVVNATEVDGSITNEIELPTGGTNGQVLKTDGSGTYAWVNQTGGNSWNTNGNSATTSSFIGTTNSIPLLFKVNNQKAGEIKANGATFFGYQAGNVNSSNTNTGIGYKALYSNTTGGSNTANGYLTLYNNNTGDYNTANGYRALYNNINGGSNTANGYYALYQNTSGGNNTANGREALYNNTTGSWNTVNGYQALYSNTTGGYNTANGYYALYKNTTGGSNTANGREALYTNTTGSNNTANGYQALYYNTTGGKNTANGYKALYNNTAGSWNTAIGRRAFYYGTTYSNSTALGYNTPISGSNQVRLGNSNVTQIKGQVAFSTYSDGRIKDNITEDVKGLEFITKLRPVTYHFNIDRQNKLMGITDSSEYDQKYDLEKIKMTGFIAQEVETAAKESGYNFSGVTAPKNSTDLYGVSYSQFVVPLVKGMQEQQAVIEQQKEEIKQQEQEIKILKKRMETIEKMILKSK